MIELGTADGSIRNAALPDALAISRLITELGYSTTAPAMVNRLGPILSDPKYLTLVAASTTEIIGVAGATLARYYEKDGVYCRLVLLVVASSARGHGVGRALVGAVEQWGAAHAAREMYVNSGLHRGQTHEFYERLGYRRTGWRFVRELG